MVLETLLEFGGGWFVANCVFQMAQDQMRAQEITVQMAADISHQFEDYYPTSCVHHVEAFDYKAWRETSWADSPDRQ